MAPPRLLYLVTEDWYFASHRLPMARAAKAAGFDVHVACRIDRHAEAIAAEGFTAHPLPWSRMNRKAGDLLREIASIRALYKDLRPSLVHQVAMKPVILGSLASSGLGLPTVNSVAGLGWGFIAKGPKAAVVRAGLGTALRILLNRPHATTIVQNPDDREALERIGVRPERLTLIPGSGVETDVLQPLPEPEGPFTVGFAGRLLADKGVKPLVEAQALLRASGEDVRLLVAGTPDPTNPATHGEDELDSWRRQEGVALLGHVADIRTLWARCHVAALPSRREGLPKALMEAAACGRALIATDVPGCREVARAGVNGLLVPVDDPAALAQAILALKRDPARRAGYAAAGRRLVEDLFSARAIGAQTVDVYRAAVGIAPPAASG
ncbi:glycosyltransferase family 4 protein [Alsobacter sp. R-9]